MEDQRPTTPRKSNAPRRRKGEGHIRKRGGGYYVVLTVNGKKVERAAGTRSADAVSLLNRFKEEMRQGVFRSEKAPTFEEFLSRFRELDDRKLKPSTRAAYASIEKVHLIPFFGQRRLDQITPTLVTRFFSELAGRTASNRKTQLSTKSLLNCHRLLTKIFNLAVDAQILTKSPVPKPKKLFPPADEKEMDFLRPDEVRRLLDALDDKEMHCLFATSVMTGMRVGELTALQWDCVDFRGKLIKVRRSFSRKELTTPKTKKGKRDIAVDSNLLQLLREHKLRSGGRGEFVFSSPSGKPLDAANLLKRQLRPALKRAGIDRPIRLHDLRHTRASILMNEGCNLKFLQEQLGHASITVTLDRYSHLIPEKHDATVESVGQLLLGAAAE